MSEPATINAWLRVADVVRGESASGFVAHNGMDIWDYYEKHSESCGYMIGAMRGLSMVWNPRAARVVANRSQLGGKIVLDVGGSGGHFLRDLVREASPPPARAINFDKPEVVASLTDGDGVEHVGGDFFDASTIPPFDVATLKWILHDWDDERATAIMRSVVSRMNEGGVVHIIEAVLPARGEVDARDAQALSMDIHMLALTGGRERSMAQWARIGDAVGLKITSESISSPAGKLFVLSLANAWV